MYKNFKLLALIVVMIIVANNNSVAQEAKGFVLDPQVLNEKKQIYLDSTLIIYNNLVWDQSNIKDINMDKNKKSVYINRKVKYVYTPLALYIESHFLCSLTPSDKFLIYIFGKPYKYSEVEEFLLELNPNIRITTTITHLHTEFEDGSTSSTPLLESVTIDKEP